MTIYIKLEGDEATVLFLAKSSPVFEPVTMTRQELIKYLTDENNQNSN